MPSLAPDGKKRRFKRRGPVSPVEKQLIAAVVMDNPGPVTPRQERALATALRRGKDTIKTLVSEAKENFAANAGRYVDIHMEATENALAEGDNETATKAASWALTNLSGDGVRVIDKAAGEATGSRIMIGIQVGAIDAAVSSVPLPKVTTVPSE